MTTKPDATEYDSSYGNYISLVPDGDIAAILRAQQQETLALLRTISEEKAGYAYAPGKWTIKQLMGHLIDSERIFSYRALRIGRNDKTPIPGFEQDDYVANATFNMRTFASLIEELTTVRQATLSLFEHFTEREWLLRGTANGKEISTRALAYIIAGHEKHHIGVLRARYLN
jgi:hypothetical protein